MRVLIINTTSLKKGGITSVIFNLVGNMDRKDVAFDMVAPGTESDEFTEKFLSYGGRVYYLPRNMKRVAQYVKALRRIIKDNNYDAIHVHGNSHTTIIELIAAKLAGCKVRFIHAHNTMCNDIKLHKILTGLFNKLCTNRLACGDDAGKFMHGEKGFDVINNGIELERFKYSAQKGRSLAEEYNLLGKKVIGHIGMFNDAKNQDFLLNITAELLKIDSNFALVLVGDGERRSLIEKKAKEMGIEDSVIFTGLTSKVTEHLSLFDVFALPSLYEGLPVVLVEAQASGIFSVVSDRVTKEADKTGNMTFLPIDKGCKIWVEEILKHFDNKNREAVSENSINDLREKGYSARDEAEKLLKLYKNAVNKTDVEEA